MGKGKFPGIRAGSAEEAKLERCVRKVKLQGRDKSSAIAIYRAAMKRKKAMTSKKVKERQKQARRRRREAARMKSEEEIPQEVTEEIEDVETEDEGFDDTLSDEELAAFDLSDEEREILAGLDEDDEFQDEEPLSEDELDDSLEEEEVEVDTEEDIAEDKAFLASYFVDPEPNLFEEYQLNILRKEWIPSDGLKAVLSTASRSKLSDASFALVKDKNGKKVRKYPIHDKAHVRNALARAAQMIKKGGEAAKDARAALPKIRAAAKKFGIGQPGKKNLNGFIIEKDVNGDFRWIGWVSNKFIDKEKEILADAAHKEFVNWTEEHSKWYVEFFPAHKKKYAFTHPADGWMYKNGFMIYTGKLEVKEAENLMAVAQKEALGMSHGFIPLKRDPVNPKIITKYRTYEVSVLPLHNAANPYTNLEVIAKELDKMSDQKDYTKFIMEVLGEDRFKEIEADTGGVQKWLEEAGVENKDVKTKTETQEESPEILKIAKELGIPEVVAWIEKADKEIDTGAEQRMILAKALKEVKEDLKQKDQEVTDQLADMIESPRSKMISILDKRPSQSKETILDEKDEKDKELLESTPGIVKDTDWLNKITKTEPMAKPN